MRYKFVIIFCFIFVIFYINKYVYVYADDVENNILKELEYTDIQDVIKEVLDNKTDFDFENMVKRIIYKKDIGFDDYVKEICENIKTEIEERKSLFIRLFLIAIISAIFCNFSNAFSNKCVSEMGFYITYLLQFSMLLSTFIISYKITEETLNNILKFMRVLIPTYSTAIIFGTGVSTAGAFYEMVFIVINVVYSICLKFILPLINVYEIIVITDNIASKRILDKFANLIKTVIKWLLRGMITILVGIQSIQKINS